MNSDLNFEKAYTLAESDFSQDILVNFLKTGDIKEKQIAALKIKTVRNQFDAEALFQNLTGCDGKIREAVALKINQLIKLGFGNFFKNPNILADASIDINANICRFAVDSAKLLKQDNIFSSKYTENILNFIREAFQELDKFIFKDKKYVINKQIFKLYWCLESLQNFYEYLDDNTLKEILEKTSDMPEYTIREKAAQIIAISNKFPDIREKLVNDENYYVRAVFKSS